MESVVKFWRVSRSLGTVQCEGDRQLCNARIEGHLAGCSRTKDRCLQEGGGSQECYQEYANCKSNMSL